MELQYIDDPTHPGWIAARAMVCRRYARTYGADIDPEPDVFLTLHVDGELGATAGLSAPSLRHPMPAARTAGSRQTRREFFSEQYLRDPLPQVVSEHYGVTVESTRIVEVGPLAAGRGGAGQELVRATPILCWCRGFSYIVCTATADLTGVFARLGIPFEPIAPAQRLALPVDQRAQWGSYYEAEPVVGVIALDRIADMFVQSTGRYVFETGPVRVTQAQVAG